MLGEPSTPEHLTAIGDEGVLALVCDSTNVFNPEESGSEGDVHAGLLEVITGAKNRVLVTTFASNAARLQTLGQVAKEIGRTLCVAGRSLDRIITNAKAARSEEHTSELPSLMRISYAVFCLQKKNKQQNHHKK